MVALTVDFEVQAFGDANANGVAKLTPTLKNLDTGATVVASLTDVKRPDGCLWLNPFQMPLNMPIKIITETTILSMTMIKLVLLLEKELVKILYMLLSKKTLQN